MASVACIRLDWDRTAIPLPLPGAWHAVHVSPEPGYPAGRKGLQLAGAWDQYAGPRTDGMLIMDGDVVADLADVREMLRAIDVAPRSVWTAWARLWRPVPGVTPWPGWVWGHWAEQPSQARPAPPAREGAPFPMPRWFSFCFTYLPRRLIDDCRRHGLESWTFPHVDTRVSQRAQVLGLPVGVVDCEVKHVHW